MKTSPDLLWKATGAALGTEPISQAAGSAHFSGGFTVLPCLLFLLGFHWREDIDTSGKLSFCSIAENCDSLPILP